MKLTDELLKKKLEIIQSLNSCMETEGRFIDCLDMKGLERTLRKCDELLTELAHVNDELNGKEDGGENSDLKELVAVIEQEQKEVLTLHLKLLKNAIAQRDTIKDGLQKIRNNKRIKNRYEGLFGFTFGSGFNVEG